MGVGAVVSGGGRGREMREVRREGRAVGPVVVGCRNEGGAESGVASGSGRVPLGEERPRREGTVLGGGETGGSWEV